MASCGEFGPSVENVVVLTSLPLFEVTHVVSVILEGDDKMKLDFLNEALPTRATMPTRLPTCPGSSIRGE